MVSISHPEPTAPFELYPYQKRWIEDDARFKGAVKSVRIGWTVGETVDVALRMVRQPTEWLWMAGTQEQSREAAQWVSKHLRAMGVVAQADFDLAEIIENAEVKLDRVRLPNGSRATFFPSNPDAARSFGGNVTLDEFAQHKDQKSVWAGMFGRAARGHKIRVFSSPKGAIGKFWEMARKAGCADGVAPATNPAKSGVWSWHWCDIHKAIGEGCPLDAEELRAAIDDDDMFAQEFLCVFLDAESQFLSNELIESAISGDASTVLPLDFLPRGPLYMGTDVGRTNDLTVHAGVEQLGERFVGRFLDLQKRATFAQQKTRAKEHLQLVRRMAIDATGIGMQNAEELVAEHPGKVEAVRFDAEIKGIMAALIKRKLEDRLFELPDDPLVKKHFKAVKRVVTESGNMRFDAARTKDGHADIFWAYALALHASDRTRMPMSEGVLAGRGVITAADAAQMATGVTRNRDWRYPDHSDDRHGGRGWRNAL